MKGERIWPDSSPVIMIGLARSTEFTDRELAVIREMVRGVRYEDMAEALHLSINTVKYHVKNILQKTGFRNTIHLVAENGYARSLCKDLIHLPKADKIFTKWQSVSSYVIILMIFCDAICRKLHVHSYR